MDFQFKSQEFLDSYFKKRYLDFILFRKPAEMDENRPASDRRPRELKELTDSFERTGPVPEWASKTVFCYDPSGSLVLKHFIDQNSSYLQRRMAKRGWNFLYVQELESLSVEDFKKFLRYHFPSLQKYLTISRTEPAELHYLARQNRLVENFLGLSGITRPCLIRKQKTRTIYPQFAADQDDKTGRTTTIWEVFYLPEEASLLDNAFNFYLYQPPEPSSVSFSRSFRIKDCDHQGEPIRVSARVHEEIKGLISMHGHSGAIELIGRILSELKKSQTVKDPRLLKIADILTAQQNNRLSKLIVRKFGQLYLEDYNLTLDLTPLQKTVYLFFLRHPEGIMFKDLTKHRPELELIYRQLSNRTSNTTIKASLDDLVNPFSNSMSEKCSRIKEAFLRHFRKDLAEHYYISGGRLTAKRISLDRNLISFEDNSLDIKS